jgi:hypothetical protein
MTLPKRIQKAQKPDKRWRSTAHRNFVRGHECCNPKCPDGRPIEVAHVRTGTDGGMGLKPSDWWTISLCRTCHGLQHNISESKFEKRAGIDMKQLASEFANASPKRVEIRKAQDE